MNEMDLKKYWRLIVKGRYLCIAVSLAVTSIVVWGSYTMPKIYEANSTVLIERNVINTLIKDIAISPSLEERIRVLSYTMTSRNLILKVINELDINVDKENPGDLERLVKKFQDKTVVTMVSKKSGKETDWFSVTYRNKDPKLARDYVNTLVRRYIEDNVSAKRDESYEANRFLGDQRKFFKEKLDKIEEDVMNFRRDKGIFIAIDEKTVVSEIKTAQENIEAIKLQKMELDAKRNLTEKQLKEERPYTVAMLGKKEGSLNDKLILLQNKLNDLMTKFTEKYPDVIRTKAEIEMLKKQLQDSSQDAKKQEGVTTEELSTLNPLHQKLKEDLSKIDVELAALSAKERHLAVLVESKKEYLRNIPVEKKNLTDLERERDTYKKIDEELVMKLGQSEVSKQMEIQDKSETFRIVDSAILPTKPVSPNRMLLILAGIAAGVGAGVGAVLLRDNLDHSIRAVEDIKKAFNAPVLAVIPRIITEEELNREKKVDKTVYAVSIAYLLAIGVLFVKEAIGL